MLFNSFEFLVFFLVVTFLFFALPHRFRWMLLLTASFIFYMAFLPVYVLILLVTIIVDYFAGIYIEQAKPKYKKLLLILSIVANVGFLCLFKYYDFFVENINSFTHLTLPHLKDLWLASGFVKLNNAVNTYVNGLIGTNFSILRNIILPIGLSFHTFQAMSYTIEVYRGNQKSERHFGIYALYVMFYPQLVAGPIERPQNVLHQFHERKKFSYENLIIGARLIIWGLFKKVVIADRLAIYVNLVYTNPSDYHWLNLVVATFLFAIQIYCDFSGYSDMALGIAKVMGYDLMINFNRPHFANNIKSFWDRWHISLTTWFRDYIYIPLGGNRKGFYRQLLNVAIIFIISGIWHGANNTFIVWGFLHALYTIFYMLFNNRFKNFAFRDSRIWNIFSYSVTNILVVFAYIFFRAENISQSQQIISNIVQRVQPSMFKIVLLDAEQMGGFGIVSILISVVAILYMIIVEKLYKPKLLELNQQPIKDIFFFTITTIFVIIAGVFVKESFIYFQF